MSNKIIIEMSEEDRARLDRIADTAERLISKGLSCYVAPEMAAEAATKADAAPAEKPEIHPVENPFPEPEAEAPEAPKYKLTDVQQKVVYLSASGKKDQVREIVKQYAEKVSAIPEDKLDEVMSRLAGLEG